MVLGWNAVARPATEPLAHVMTPVTAAPVAERVTQEKGLLAKYPESFPEETIVFREAYPWVVQPDSTVLSLEGLVPPPNLVSGGENVIVAENEQLTEPSPH